MSDKSECPFEYHQDVTDGVRLGVVQGTPLADKTIQYGTGWIECGGEDIESPDWSKWVAFDPADIAEYPCEVAAAQAEAEEEHRRAERAEARVKELEAEVESFEQALATHAALIESMKSVPPGHVALIMRRSDARQWLHQSHREETRAQIEQRGERFMEALEKALEVRG